LNQLFEMDRHGSNLFRFVNFRADRATRHHHCHSHPDDDLCLLGFRESKAQSFEPELIPTEAVNVLSPGGASRKPRLGVHGLLVARVFVGRAVSQASGA